MALLGEGAGQVPLFQSAWAYTAQGMSGSGLYSASGGAGGLRQIRRRPKPGRLNFFRPPHGWAKARGKAPYGAGVRHGWGWNEKVMYPCGEKRYVGVKGRGM